MAHARRVNHTDFRGTVHPTLSLCNSRHFVVWGGCVVSPLTLGKSKRWQPAIESSRGSPDRCAEREYVQVRWRAAHERLVVILVSTSFFCSGFFCADFSVPPQILSVSRSGIRQQAHLAHHCLLKTRRYCDQSYRTSRTSAAATCFRTFAMLLIPYLPMNLCANLLN